MSQRRSSSFRMAAYLAAAGLNIIGAPVEFNRDVRPILSDRCYPCHGPDPANRKTSLRFDQEQTTKRVLVPGKPDESEVFRRISSTDNGRRMPPAYAGHSRLEDRDIATIRQWITEGARYQPHWAFIPPAGKTGATVDSIVRARLDRDRLRPAPEADRISLLRRVSLDLTGLPPTSGELAAFRADASPAAYEKVVNRLLSSPHYAERMTIRWLEAARYADTNGYQTDGPRDMWRWRDWVINAFQSNMPFDRFTIEQLAGDLLPNATRDQIIATAFHRNHRTSAEGGIVEEEFRSEYVSDRAETTSTVWLGLTVGCARCHDHKYDPIPQRDYYRFYSFFNNMIERGLVYNFGNEEPTVKAPTAEMERKLADLDATLAIKQAAWDRMQPHIAKAQSAWAPPPIQWSPSKGRVIDEKSTKRFDGKSATDLDDKVAKFNYLEPFSLAAWIRPESPNGAILSRGEDYLEGNGYYLLLVDGKLRLTITLRYTDISLRVETEDPLPLNEWRHVAVTYNGRRKAAGVHIYVNGEERRMRVLFDDLTYPFGAKVPFRIGAGAGLRFTGDIRGVLAYDRELTPQEASALPLEETLQAVAAKPARTAAESNLLRLAYLDQFAHAEVNASRAALDSAERERDKYFAGIPTVMIMREGPLRQAHILKRGAYDAPGEPVTAGVPAFLPPLMNKPNGSVNRLDLARWLVNRGNPLTARVTINRYWQMLFGVGLVKTTEDFGSQGEWPVQAELLDWLAVEFMESGWNVKSILKTIVMSGTYRQSSKVSAALLALDPENRLLARGPRVRLSPEMIRDQALAISGLLVDRQVGPSVKPYQPPGLWQELQGGGGYAPDHGDGLYRRGLYTYWRRTVAPPSMTNFDSPTREVCTVRESRTNTPLQALNLMNDTIFVEASRKLAERMLREGGSTAESRLAYAVRLTLTRDAKPEEMAVLLASLRRFESRYADDPSGAAAMLTAGESKIDPRLNVPQLAAYSTIANLILNLDETVTKQ